MPAAGNEEGFSEVSVHDCLGMQTAEGAFEEVEAQRR
jgi:hypothetical protein